MNHHNNSNRPAAARSRSRVRPFFWPALFLVCGLFLAALAGGAAWAQSPPKAAPPPGVDPADQARLAEAIPAKAAVPPLKPRRLLVFDSNVNYGGHRSAAYANEAFTLMGKKTGAFETLVSHDPAVFQGETLRKFDAVFLNNTVGNLFEDPKLRQNLVEFVYGGGGLLGVHGTSVAFTRWPGAIEDWPEFGRMIGARGANHRDNTEHVFIKLDDPEHPVNRVFGGKGFDYRDEFFRVHEPYSRNRVRVLLSIDTEKTETQGQARGDCYRADNDYALAWVRNYGRGRVFYCTIAHNPYVFMDAQMLQFYLAATQFALGDLPAPTIPSGRLTPAIRAQEKLGWRLGLEAETRPKDTLFATIAAASRLGLPYLNSSSGQKVSKDIAKPFDQNLSDDELQQVRLELDAASVRLLTHRVGQMPADPDGCRKLFEFARKIGVETLVAEPAPEALDVVEKLCDEFDIQLALLGRPAAPRGALPEDLLKLCQGRSKRMGVCGDLGAWLRGGVDPIAAANLLKERLIVVRLPDPRELDPQSGNDGWESGAGKIDEFLTHLRRLGVRPAMISLECGGSGGGVAPDAARYVELLGKISLKLEK